MKERSVLSKNIIGQRKKLGLSQKAISKRLGVPTGTYNSWEYSIAVPGIEKLIRISNFFGLLVDDLVGNGGWVDVKTLPEQDGDCKIAVRIFATIKGNSINSDGIYDKGRFYIDGLDVTKNVTHWRAIPLNPNNT